MKCISITSEVLPRLRCTDASLAVQSEKQGTLIEEILKRFQATGSLPNLHHPSTAVDPALHPMDFQDAMNKLTDIQCSGRSESDIMSDFAELNSLNSQASSQANVQANPEQTVASSEVKS